MRGVTKFDVEFFSGISARALLRVDMGYRMHEW